MPSSCLSMKLTRRIGGRRVTCSSSRGFRRQAVVVRTTGTHVGFFLSRSCRRTTSMLARAETEEHAEKQPETSATADETASEKAEESAEPAEEEKPPGPQEMVERMAVLLNEGSADGAAELVDDLKQAVSTALGEAQAAEDKALAYEDQMLQTKEVYLRLKADFDNFRKRSESEQEQTGRRVKASVVEELLPIIDNFDMASQQVKPTNEGEEKIHKSYQGLYRQMVDIFRGLGLEAVPTEGSPFDPEVHDAIMREPNDDLPDGTVVQEFRKGFTFDGKLLRPAMVKVSFSEAATDSAAEDGAAEGAAAPQAEPSKADSDAASA